MDTTTQTTFGQDLIDATSLRSEVSLPALRRVYRAVVAGTAPAGWERDSALYRAAARAGSACVDAFTARGLVRFVTCTHCKGDGVSRGTDRGMGCGYCHGKRVIAADYADFLMGHRARIEARYGHGASRT